MRPVTQPPIIASDATYSAPTKVWDGAPTKLVPLGSKVARGLEPSERPAPEFLNWVLNTYGGHLAHLDALEVQNWTPSSTVVGALGGGSLPVSGSSVAWDPLSRRFFLANPKAGSTGGVWTSPNLIEWAHSLVADEPIGMAVGATGYVVAAFSNGDLQRRAPGGNLTTWAAYAPTLQKALNGIAWDSETSRFVAWGTKDMGLGPGVAPNAGIWSATEDLGTITLVAVGSAVYASEINLVALGPGKKLAIGSFRALVGDPVSTHTWTSADVSAPWTDRGAWTGGLPVGLVWDGSRSVFAMACLNGEVWISPDGIAWTKRQDASADRVFLPFTLALVSGSIWVAVAMSTTNPTLVRLVYSLDAGITWLDVPYPLNQSAAAMGLISTGGRAVLVAKDGSDLVVASSLRLGA